MIKKKILFVPQTERNKDMLLLYAQKLAKEFNVFFLRTKIFGNKSDMGNKLNYGIKLLSPEFLMNDPWRDKRIQKDYFVEAFT